jgi:L-alanine-DL-glutamate epimerase-like enolase superfamily enzyme
MEGKWWDVRKKYGLSQSNSYGEGVGRLFYGVKITADNGCEGYMFGRAPTGSYGSGRAVGFELNREQDINDTAFFESNRQSFIKTWEALKQYDPMNTEQIWFGLWSSGCNGSVAEALWDLKARFVGLPLHQLIGGTGRKRVKAYASSFCDMGTPDEYAEHAQDCYVMGYRAYKIHPYRCLNPATMKPAGANTAFPEWDIEICRAVRAKVGDKMELMLDPDGIYKTLEDAITVGRELKKLNFKWYEAPITERENWENYGKLRAAVNVPLCGPENAGGGNKVRILWHNNGWSDILRAGGGFIDLVGLGAYAREAGLKCEVHGGGWMAINAIACFSEEVMEYYEQLLVQPGHSEFSLEYIEGGSPLFENGEIIVPTEPGAGYGPHHWPYAEENSLRSFVLE